MEPNDKTPSDQTEGKKSVKKALTRPATWTGIASILGALSRVPSPATPWLITGAAVAGAIAGMLHGF